MINANAKNYQTFIEEELAAASATEWMAAGEGQVRYGEGKEVEINTLNTTGLGDYDSTKTDGSAYPAGAVTSKWTGHTLAMDRGVKFALDRSDTDGEYTVASGANGLAAKIWLPSIIEVARGSAYMDGAPRFYVEEGAVFDYWADANTERYLLWEYEDEYGDDQGWGTRTPNTYSSGDESACFHVVLGNGMCYNGITDQVMVRPCMVLPDEVLVVGDNYIRAGRVVYTKIGGAWCEGGCSTKVGGAWKELAQLAVKVGGAWKE